MQKWKIILIIVFSVVCNHLELRIMVCVTLERASILILEHGVLVSHHWPWVSISIIKWQNKNCLIKMITPFPSHACGLAVTTGLHDSTSMMQAANPASTFQSLFGLVNLEVACVCVCVCVRVRAAQYIPYSLVLKAAITFDFYKFDRPLILKGEAPARRAPWQCHSSFTSHMF